MNFKAIKEVKFVNIQINFYNLSPTIVNFTFKQIYLYSVFLFSAKAKSNLC